MVIIGLLAAILIPYFARARFTAELNACEANLKGVAQSATLYANDNSQLVPSSLAVLTQGTGGQRAYMGYVPTCPSNGLTYHYDYDTSGNTWFTIECQGIHYKTLWGGNTAWQNYPQWNSALNTFVEHP